MAFSRKTKGKARKGLSPSQVIILTYALAGPVRMMRGDRLGTRCVGYDDDSGAAQIVAYCTPEHFLLGRGLLRSRNELNVYDITDKGRALLGKPAVIR